jgi:hypothetical protein
LLTNRTGTGGSIDSRASQCAKPEDDPNLDRNGPTVDLAVSKIDLLISGDPPGRPTRILFAGLEGLCRTQRHQIRGSRYAMSADRDSSPEHGNHPRAQQNHRNPKRQQRPRPHLRPTPSASPAR